MILSSLSLRNFRTYESLDIDFAPGLNLILGENAVGKTNLAEAIQYLSLARSWRSNEDRLLIKDGQDSAYVRASVREGNLSRTLEMEIGKDAKRISLNGKLLRRLSELSRLVNVILFSPKDVSLFLGSPSARRGFLDLSLSKHSSDYFNLISRYGRLLKERNAVLKQGRIDQALLDVITEQMIACSELIVRYRQMYVAEINRVLPSLLSRLRGENSPSKVVYRPFVKDDGSFQENARKAFLNAKESDLLHRQTSVGPHREDISFLLNGKDLADYGSQGENRMAVLALKLTPYLLIEEEEKKPICVLDDVTSELDKNHVENLMGILKEFSQVFVTATHLDIEGASIIDVAANSATRRN